MTLQEVSSPTPSPHVFTMNAVLMLVVGCAKLYGSSCNICNDSSGVQVPLNGAADESLGKAVVAVSLQQTSLRFVDAVCGLLSSVLVINTPSPPVLLY